MEETPGSVTRCTGGQQVTTAKVGSGDGAAGPTVTNVQEYQMRLDKNSKTWTTTDTGCRLLTELCNKVSCAEQAVNDMVDNRTCITITK